MGKLDFLKPNLKKLIISGIILLGYLVLVALFSVCAGGACAPDYSDPMVIIQSILLPAVVIYLIIAVVIRK